MTSVYFFKIDKKTEYDKSTLPPAVASHCKKPESIAAAKELIEMGVENLHYEENGKPVADNCFVSISHSENMVAVCKSDVPIGIDIEFIDKERDTKKISNRFYHGKELEYVKNSPFDNFYEIWTKKEAYSKIDGNGAVEIAKGFDVLSLDGYEFETEKIGEYMLSLCKKVGK